MKPGATVSCVKRMRNVPASSFVSSVPFQTRCAGCQRRRGQESLTAALSSLVVVVTCEGMFEEAPVHTQLTPPDGPVVESRPVR